MTLARNPATGKEFTKYADNTVAHRNYVVGVLSKMWGRRVAHEGLVAVHARFLFLRTADHFRTGKHAGELKPWAAEQEWASSGYDLDKMCRLVGDALEISGVLANDRQIALWRAERVWGETTGTELRVVVL